MDIQTLAQRYKHLPSTWKVVPLGDVLAAIIGGGTPSRTVPSYWSGEIPWLTVKDMRTRRPVAAQEHISSLAVCESSTTVIPPDTVIIATRVGLGKVVRVPFAAAINQDLKALVVEPELDKSYLEYWILSIAQFLEEIGSGTTVKGIRLETLRRLPFPLAPLPVQRRIVADVEKQFSRLDVAVTNLRRVRHGLLTFRRASLQVTFDAAGRATAKRLEEVCEVISGFAFKSEDFVGSGVSVVKIANVGYGEFTSKDQEYLPVEFKTRYQAFRIQPGDVLLALTRPVTGNTLKVCAYPAGAPPALLNQRVALLRAATPGDSRYLLALMHSPQFKRQVLGSVSQTLQPNLSPVDLRRFHVSWPPVGERERIVAEVDRRLSIVREVEAEVDANLKRAQALRQAVLQRAFASP